MEFYTRFNPPPKVGLEFTEPSMTEQHFKDECDINNIIKTYQQTGVLPSGDRQPLFGDFADFPQDLQSSQAYFDDAQERFMQLPAQLRKEFDNDPVKLLQFVADGNNRDRAIELGLIERPPQANASQANAPVSSQSTNVETSPAEQAKT